MVTDSVGAGEWRICMWKPTRFSDHPDWERPVSKMILGFALAGRLYSSAFSPESCGKKSSSGLQQCRKWEIVVHWSPRTPAVDSWTDRILNEKDFPKHLIIFLGEVKRKEDACSRLLAESVQEHRSPCLSSFSLPLFVSFVCVCVWHYSCLFK